MSGQKSSGTYSAAMWGGQGFSALVLKVPNIALVSLKMVTQLCSKINIFFLKSGTSDANRSPSLFFL